MTVKKLFDMDFVEYGKRLKKIRREHGLVQDNVADYINVTRAHYSGIETAKHGPGLKPLIGIRNFYIKNFNERFSLDWFCFGDESQSGQRLLRPIESREKDLLKENESLKKEVEMLREQLEDKKSIIDLMSKK